MNNILLVSNNPALLTELDELLSEEGYTSVEYELRTTFLINHSLWKEVNAIVLDLTLQEDEVLAFLHRLKVHLPFTPIIALVKPGDVQMAVHAMQAGVSSALALPLEKRSLIKFIQEGIDLCQHFYRDQRAIQHAIALLQSIHLTNKFPMSERSKYETDEFPSVSDTGGLLEFGDIVIDTMQQKVLYLEEAVDLTPTQYKVLVYLVEAHDRVVTFEELYFHLHGIHLDRASARKALTAHMSNLRAKLNEWGCGECLINIRGRGYTIQTTRA
jgi:DNA-binding response OmpR family regulator